MSRSLIKEITERYDKSYLKPLFGEGRIRNELLTGLELVLKTSTIQEHTQPGKRVDLGKTINYALLKEISVKMGKPNAASILRRRLFGSQITTYKSLVDYVEEISKKEPERVFTDNEFRGKDIWVNVGEGSLSVLYRHLDLLSIKLFSDDYTQRELGYGS